MRIFTATLLLATAISAPLFANDTEAVLKETFGKKMYWVSGQQAGWVMSKKNGRLSGELAGKKLKGNWEIRDGYYCRSGSLGGQKFPTACQEIKRIEGGVQFIDVAGQKGEPRNYYFKKPK